MNHSPPPDFDPQPLMQPGIQQQAKNSKMSHGMQAAQGNNNIQHQGNINLTLLFKDVIPRAIVLGIKLPHT